MSQIFFLSKKKSKLYFCKYQSQTLWQLNVKMKNGKMYFMMLLGLLANTFYPALFSDVIVSYRQHYKSSFWLCPLDLLAWNIAKPAVQAFVVMITSPTTTKTPSTISFRIKQLEIQLDIASASAITGVCSLCRKGQSN